MSKRDWSSLSPRCQRELFIWPSLSESQLFLSLPNDPPKVSLIGEENTWCGSSLDGELVALNSEVSPLLGTIPFLIPRHIDGRNEITVLDALFATIGNHRLVQSGALLITHAGLAIFCSRQHDETPFFRQDQKAFGM